MKSLVLLVSLMGCVGIVHGAESVSEKVEATGNDAGRAVKSGAHRVQESVCAKSDAQCLAEKAKHRGEEGTDYAKDKAKELKNSVDGDDKKN